MSQTVEEAKNGRGDPSSLFELRRDKEDLNLRLLRPERNALDQTEPHGEAEPERSDGTPLLRMSGRAWRRWKNRQARKRRKSETQTARSKSILHPGGRVSRAIFQRNAGKKNGRGERI